MRAYLTVIGSMTFLVACSSSTSDGGLNGSATGGASSSAGGSSSVGGASPLGGASASKGGSGTATGGSTAGPGAGGAATGGNTTGAGGNTTGTGGSGTAGATTGKGGSGTAGATTGKGGSGTAGTASGTGGSGTAGTSSGGPPSTCAQANGDLGCCDGDNLYFCQGTMGPSMQSCAGKGCGWDPMKNWYDCGFTGSDPSGTTPLMCGGGSSGTGGTGSGGTSSGTGGAGGSGTTGAYDCPNDASDPLAAARIECVKTINNYRATLSLPLLKRWCGNATCEDKQGTQDFMKNTAHSAFGQCGEFAQDECPGWPDTPLASIDGCLKQMWAEGPGPAGCANDPTCYEMHGHYLNMSSTKYSMVECGFSEVGGGKWWGVQDFK